MGDPTPVLERENPPRVVVYDQRTKLPVISDADTFFAYAADPSVNAAMREELVEVACAGPMRRYGQFNAAPVDDDTWFESALGIAGLEERHLSLFTLAIAEGPSCDLSRSTRLILEHPACTDEVVCALIQAASYRRNLAGKPEKVPSILTELDRAGHPAAVAWRLSHATGTDWVPGLDRRALVARLREMGAAATRAADRLAPTWTGELGDLLDLAAAIGAHAHGAAPTAAQPAAG